MLYVKEVFRGKKKPSAPLSLSPLSLLSLLPCQYFFQPPPPPPGILLNKNWPRVSCVRAQRGEGGFCLILSFCVVHTYTETEESRNFHIYPLRKRVGVCCCAASCTMHFLSFDTCNFARKLSLSLCELNWTTGTQALFPLTAVTAEAGPRGLWYISCVHRSKLL